MGCGASSTLRSPATVEPLEEGWVDKMKNYETAAAVPPPASRKTSQGNLLEVGGPGDAQQQQQHTPSRPASNTTGDELDSSTRKKRPQPDLKLTIPTIDRTNNSNNNNNNTTTINTATSTQPLKSPGGNRSIASLTSPVRNKSVSSLSASGPFTPPPLSASIIRSPRKKRLDYIFLREFLAVSDNPAAQVNMLDEKLGPLISAGVQRRRRERNPALIEETIEVLEQDAAVTARILSMVHERMENDEVIKLIEDDDGIEFVVGRALKELKHYQTNGGGNTPDPNAHTILDQHRNELQQFFKVIKQDLTNEDKKEKATAQLFQLVKAALEAQSAPIDEAAKITRLVAESCETSEEITALLKDSSGLSQKIVETLKRTKAQKEFINVLKDAELKGILKQASESNGIGDGTIKRSKEGGNTAATGSSNLLNRKGSKDALNIRSSKDSGLNVRASRDGLYMKE